MALLWLVQVSFWCLSLATISSSSSSSSYSSMNSNCQTSCGNISIPYPFGLGQDPTCFRNKDFIITCNYSVTPPKAILWGEEVLDISLQGQLRARMSIQWDCYSKSGHRTKTLGYGHTFRGAPCTISNTHNKLTAIGCDTQAYMWGVPYTNFVRNDVEFGCMASCWNTTGVINGSCTGIGCCQASIPAGLNVYEVSIRSFNHHRAVWSFNPCSYAFLADNDFNFTFSVSDLLKTNFRDRNKDVPVVLDWVAGNETCQTALRNKDYACLSKNSECSDSNNGPGYRCSCSPGYEGNPYLIEGCQDINECQTGNNSCKQICSNIPGSYQCKCRKGYKGDGWNNGTGCIAEGIPILNVTLGTSSCLLFLLIASTWAYCLWRKRRSIKLKEKFFLQNRGLMLQQKISTRRGNTFKIFTTKELERATNNYNAGTIVGEGGFGIVYKGVLPNNQIVAIKKSKLVDASQIEQFINELDILSQVNHRNVVKLLGCCLEDQVPILVYEFVSNGTLYHHIHELGHLPSFSLENRLRIATEIAEALAYLHSAASIPIFHRDVKSANILLDDNLTAKVADFGVSRLVPIDHTQITTLVQGTWGYLDPECFQTGKLTDKSDVYSFGVVLVELLTGEKAVCLNRSQEKNLAMYFVHSMKENHLFQTLEDRIRNEASEEQLMAIAQLAMRCLTFKGEERPTMKEVVANLLGLRGFQDHLLIKNKDTERLVGETSQGCTEDAGGQYSIESKFDISLILGR
eukprot:TRINITY_DN17871_c0_g1_i2.p1 TRINITY_DN17871_c0_g1~~TRINITY_DN17871_c0_g1_i2.p1  ORF type:complete len:743 (+),score=63.50 TRINITY_DN17871_c0_g1_i2:317-2545(+)